MKSNVVGAYRVDSMEEYPRLQAPFDPEERYPEIPSVPTGETSNPVFRGFRDFLAQLGFDLPNYGSSEWNPLGWLIKPGDLVVIKPNLVVSTHPLGDRFVRYTNTDGPLVRAVAEYALLALRGAGTLVFGDSPIKETDFRRAATLTGLDPIVECLRLRSRDVAVELIDFRDFVSRRSEGAMVDGRQQDGDPRGYVHFDLGPRSALEAISHASHRFRSTAAFYENKMRETHSPGRHRYGIAASVMNADVFINLPKLKTHCKAGITVALKNLVGICNEKRWLPHHRVGSPKSGGDLFSENAPFWVRTAETLKDSLVTSPKGRLLYPGVMSIHRALRRLTRLDLKKLVRGSNPYQNGGWYGNDTVWRMVLDLNKILLYGTSQGEVGQRSARRIFHIVDGLWAGEGEGPLEPDPKVAGVMIAGSDAVLVDLVAATIMGFDWRKIKLLEGALQPSDLPLTDCLVNELSVVSNHPGWRSLDGIGGEHLAFRCPRGWRDHIELTDRVHSIDDADVIGSGR